MISKKMETAINDQINWEMWSAYLYLSMAAYFEDKNLPGFANWMKIQYEEEMAHAMKFFSYLTDRGGRVLLQPIKEVPTEWGGIVNVYEETLKHEREVSSLINKLMDVALEERDHAAVSFLKWYVDEQVEEEANVEDILAKLKMVGGEGHALFFMDKEFGTRTLAPEAE